ncbi:hypothetical protein DAEQUDRAFT_234767 [Daedalea quercina L-15889]|uniref:Protein-S-isoprenylcysteine O-methyltransferase n=1 Tax=Daedalea quercina L-15889 TaxID=1314783 RepID=A0A165QVQ3_9APHY|nr:hypothetical protein DAEQUDRAFT_234767 [Daedalea quercina L-15889]
MSLVKLPFLFTGLLSGYAITSAPQPKVATVDRHRDVRPFERWFSATVRIHSFILKVLTCGPPIIEMAVIIADHFPDHPVSNTVLATLVRGPLSVVRHITWSPAFLVSWAVGTLAGVVRVQCYQTLGRFFTFEVSIHDDHKIVEDHWYGVVRHPSYVSGSLSVIGLGLMNGVRGSWFRECRVLQTGVGKVAAGTWLVLTVYVTLSMAWRSREEDRILKKQFGDEWEAYARRVRWRWIPFIW